MPQNILYNTYKILFFCYLKVNLIKFLLNYKRIDQEANGLTLKLKRTLMAPDKLSTSIVTCLDWSLQHPELLLCSYDNLSFNYGESTTEATAALWNVKLDQTMPQQTFTCTVRRLFLINF
jgi:hypothetical protein